MPEQSRHDCPWRQHHQAVEEDVAYVLIRRIDEHKDTKHEYARFVMRFLCTYHAAIERTWPNLVHIESYRPQQRVYNVRWMEQKVREHYLRRVEGLSA